MRYIFFVLSMFCMLQAEAVTLRPDYPKRYIVQPGDTLWGIACKYLEKPWEWKTLWQANPQIKNPNRLYPGAVLELRYFEHNPFIRVLSNGTIKLSPYVRPMPIEDAIPAISLVDLKPFLNASLVMDDTRLQNAPYVVAFMGEHMLGGQGDEIYVKNLHPNREMPKGATISYAVYRPGCPYLDAETQELLGFKATLVGYGELVRGGEPAVMILTGITEGVKLRDRVLLNDFPEFNLYFQPKTPLFPVKGRILDLPPDYTQGASGLVAIINKGQNAGLEPGDILGIYSPPHLVPDPMCKKNPLCKVKTICIPRERVGEMMIFRTFSKTSFGLVVRSIRTIHLMDIVTNP